jgi:hypothetical protein
MPEPTAIEALHTCLLDSLERTRDILYPTPQSFAPDVRAKLLVIRLDDCLAWSRQCAAWADASIASVRHTAKRLHEALSVTGQAEGHDLVSTAFEIPAADADSIAIDIYHCIQQLRSRNPAIAIPDIHIAPERSWRNHQESRLAIESWAMGLLSAGGEPSPEELAAHTALVEKYDASKRPTACYLFRRCVVTIEFLKRHRQSWQDGHATPFSRRPPEVRRNLAETVRRIFVEAIDLTGAPPIPVADEMTVEEAISLVAGLRDVVAKCDTGGACRIGKAAAPGTVAAVRKVIADWDGTNWTAVEEALRNAGRSRDEIDVMDEMRIQMAFATMPAILKISTAATTAAVSAGVLVGSVSSQGPQVWTLPTNDRDDVPSLNDTEETIVEALREAGHRMRGDDLAARALGKTASDGHSKSVFAALVKRNIIDNRRDLKPSGYGLPEWGGDGPNTPKRKRT